jgi:hypothetical protein
MIRKIRITLSLISVMVATSCETPIKVTTDYDKSVNFSRYTTFAMLTLNEKDQSISQLNANRILKAVKTQMLAKGFEEDTASPDMKVNVVTIMTNKQEISANTNNYGYGGAYRPYGWGAGSGYTTVDVKDYTDGSLIVEVIDASNNQLIWEGVGNKDIDGPSKNPDETIPAAIAKIMKDFPPGKNKK